MNTWQFYDSASGVFVGRSYAGPPEFLDVNTPAGCLALPDDQLQGADWRAYRVSGQQLVPYTPPAVVPDPNLLATAARARRDLMLALCDYTQLSDTPATALQLVAWRTYRTALRGIPQQPGFPQTITWPVAPDGTVSAPGAAPLPTAPPAGPPIALPPPPPAPAPPPNFPLPPPP